MPREVNRRDVLRLSTAAVAALSLSSCSLLSLDPDKEGQGGSGGGDVDTRLKEAPMLDELVQKGELPKLAERLPETPLVVKPQDGLGTYGGRLRRAQAATDVTGSNYMTFAGLMEWSPTTPTKPVPGLAESCEPDAENKVFTVKLRKGLKWSDGEPFTTKNIMWVYDNVLKNKDLSPAFPAWLTVAGKPVVFTAEDETTLTVTFAGPHSLFLKYLCFVDFGGALLTPSHYMEQFHKEHIPAADMKKLMKDTGLGTWPEVFNTKNDRGKNQHRPALGPWVLKKPITATNSSGTVERNPYYWKVDPEGRQLPYIDSALFQAMSLDAIGLRAGNGELDLQAWDLPDTALPVLIKNEEAKDYTVKKWVTDGNTSICLNMSHADPVLRDLFNKVDFRAGFSHAINRDAMNEALLGGQGTPIHPCAQPEDEYWVEGYGQRFIEFDADEANKRLDAAGLKKRDAKGMRLRPDGKPMRFVMRTFKVGVGLDQTTVLEYAKRDLAKVGIDTVIKNISQDLWYTEIIQGQFDIVCYPFPGYQWDIDPLWYVPVNEFTYWCPKFGRNYYDPKHKFSAEPTPEIKKLQTLYDQLKSAPNDEARLDFGHQILKAHDENVWIIGSIPMPYFPVVINDDLKNFRDSAVASFRQHYEAASDLAQLTYGDPGSHT